MGVYIMAKMKKCPFTGRACTECPLYRARHCNLGFSKSYRGYLGEEKESEKPSTPSVRTRWKAGHRFEFGPVHAPSAMDPVAIALKEIEKEQETGKEDRRGNEN
jgi:hypothetical protein